MTDRYPNQARLLGRAKELPSQPGVYLMKDAFGRILYIGKAKSLRNRVRSYFQKADGLAPRTRLLVCKIIDIEFTVTSNELEALLLECNLIKKHRPRYNVRLKDDKNYPYVVIDFTHPFPQFRITRRVIPSPHLRYFGPFSGGATEIGRFLLKTFQIRDCSDSKFKNRSRPCLNYEIGTCTAPCVDYVSQEDYAKQVKDATLFLKGKKQALVRSLKKEMAAASGKLEYERARTLRDKITSIEKLTQKQGSVMAESRRDIDVIGSFETENEIQWVVLFVRNGFLTGRRPQRVPVGLGNSEDAIRTFLEQFYTVSLIPDEVWVARDFPDRATLETFLSQQAGKKVAIRVRRSEKSLRLLGMASENAKLLYMDYASKKGESPSVLLQKALGLRECPHSIEGIDVSNLQGTNPAIALVHFADERPLKSRYRLYYPKTVEGQNDFAMIYETVLRRFGKPDPPPPDLLLIDGGKGQLGAAMKALDELKLDIPVCALAKARTERAFTLKEVERSRERVFLPQRKNPLNLKEGNPALKLLQQVRDEAHRFSVKNQRKRRTKSTLHTSSLLDVRGLGEVTRAKLLQHFGSLEAIRGASVDAIRALGVSQAVAERLVGTVPKSKTEGGQATGEE